MKLGDRLIAGLQYAIATIVLFLLSALAVFIVWGSAHAGELERCYRRCEKNNPPLPSPVPTHSPKPLPCEPIGGVKTFAEGEPRMFCFDIAAGGSAIVEVASTTPANSGCSYFRSQLTAPNGTKANTDGAYPMAATWRMPGRYYFFVEPIQIGEGLCSTYSFTVSR